jgi:peptidoglycan/LPS O-acetylase OafA/YrhL
VGLRRGFKAAAGLLLVAPILRVVYFVVQPAGLNPAFAFETVGDAIAAGCLLASCREKLWNYLLYRQLLQSRRMLAVPTALVAAGFLGSGYAKGFNPNMLRGFMQSLGYTVPEILAFLYQLLGISVLNVCIAVCIDWCIRFPISRVGRLLNSALLIQIGVMSYSIYLWQQPFLNNGDSRDLAAYPLNIVLVLLAATFSYYLVERPMLRAREYVEPRIWQPLIAARRGVTATLEVKTEGHEG